MGIKLGNYALVLALLLLSFACKTKNDVEAFKEAEYSLAGVDSLMLNGINLLNKKGPQDFSFNDASRLFSAFSDNSLQATSTLGLNVQLPEGSEDRTMTVTQLKWQLLVGEEQALSGIVSEPVELRNGLNTITVNSPLQLAADAKGNTDLSSLLRLATMLNQKDPNAPRLSLQIKPTIQTSIGPVELPAYIKVKD